MEEVGTGHELCFRLFLSYASLVGEPPINGTVPFLSIQPRGRANSPKYWVVLRAMLACHRADLQVSKFLNRLHRFHYLINVSMAGRLVLGHSYHLKQWTQLHRLL